MRTLCLLLSFIILIPLVATAGDLYKVKVTGPLEASQLKSIGGEPIARLHDGYLILVESKSAAGLATSELDYELVATGVVTSELALDNRFDETNSGRYEVIFEQENFRLFRVEAYDVTKSAPAEGLSPVRNEGLEIEYFSSRATSEEMMARMSALDLDLDSLIGLVEEDSLLSYVERLQAFYRRTAGTDSNYVSRDWIAGKLTSFGYDSVVIDSFTASLSGVTRPCQNVLAYKIGTRFPNHYIVVGGHRDAVAASPGADDDGSGTAGVLEFARIFADIETEMTIVFALFDAEEYGLYGSYHYADEAEARGDTIVYMFNMDMIGAINNDYDVTVYHGSQMGFTDLFNYLADSLQGVNGVLSGTSAQSDHYPFQQKGWEVTFIIEYNFSPVYHTFQDSVRFMDFTYMTRLVKSGLATVYTVNATAGPYPSVAFDFPGDTPVIVEPEEAVTFDVQVSGVFEGVPVPGSGMMYYSLDGGAYTATAMTDMGGDLYEAYLPAADCDQRFEYYFTADESTMGTVTFPDPSEPILTVVATELLTPLADDFQTDQGWTTAVVGATSGGWQRGVPVNDPSWAYDPETDGDGSGACYLTQNVVGNTDVDGGTVRLTSPEFEMAEGGYLEYDYFLVLTNTSGGVDALLVEISDNGGTSWHEIARHTSDGGMAWSHSRVEASAMLAAGASLTTNMKVRFSANDGDPQSIVEAGVDGFEASYYFCQPPWVCGDANNSGDGPDIEDLVYLVDFMFAGGPPPPNIEAMDMDGSGEGPDVSDLVWLVEFMFANGPDLACPQ